MVNLAKSISTVSRISSLAQQGSTVSFLISFDSYAFYYKGGRLAHPPYLFNI